MTVEYKVCTKCGESKPATSEFFHKRCNTISARCKVCVCTDKRSAAEKQPAHYRWKAMMGRCYNVEHERYNTYGGIGVVVCNEWHDYGTFQDWCDKHLISGWHVDKDILGGATYSPENCVFAPIAINTFFTFTKSPSIIRMGRKYRVKISIKGKTSNLCGDTEEDVLEQFYLFKELYLEKLVWEMKEEHKRLCEKYPNTPQISPKLLSILENFSTEEYLRKKQLPK